MEKPYKEASYAPMPKDLRIAIAVEKIDIGIKFLFLALCFIAGILAAK